VTTEKSEEFKMNRQSDDIDEEDWSQLNLDSEIFMSQSYSKTLNKNVDS
jgi:hypothetical protein